MSIKEKKYKKELKELKKRTKNTPFTVSSGPLIKSPDKEAMFVTVQNKDNRPQKVTISIANTSLHSPFELPKEARICGELVTDPLPPSDTEIDLSMVFSPLPVEIPPNDIVVVKGQTLRIPLTETDTYEVKATATTPNIEIKTWEDMIEAGVAEPQIENPVILTDQVAVSHLQAVFKDGFNRHDPVQFGLTVAVAAITAILSIYALIIVPYAIPFFAPPVYLAW